MNLNPKQNDWRISMTKCKLLLLLPFISLSCKTMNQDASKSVSVAEQDSRGNYIVFHGTGDGDARQVTLYRCGTSVVSGVEDSTCSKADSKNWTRDILEPLKRTSHVSGDRVIRSALDGNPDAIFGVLKRPDVFQSPDLQASWDALARGLMEIFVDDPLAQFANVANPNSTSTPTAIRTGVFPGLGIYASEKKSCARIIIDFEMFKSFSLIAKVNCWFVVSVDTLDLLTITVTDEYGIDHAADFVLKKDGTFKLKDKPMTFEIVGEKAVFSRAGKSLDMSPMATHSEEPHSVRVGRALGGFKPLPGKRDDVIAKQYFSEDNSGFKGWIKLEDDGHAEFRPNGQSKTFDGYYTLEKDSGEYSLVVYFRGGEIYRDFGLDRTKCWLNRLGERPIKRWYLHALHDTGCSAVARPIIDDFHDESTTSSDSSSGQRFDGYTLQICRRYNTGWNCEGNYDQRFLCQPHYQGTILSTRRVRVNGDPYEILTTGGLIEAISDAVGLSKKFLGSQRGSTLEIKCLEAQRYD
jgi:hypothetical protein